MFPEIFRYGVISIKSYGLFLAAAFLISLMLLKAKTKKLGIPDAIVEKLFLWILISAIIGSRAVYVFAEWKYYKSHFIEAFRIWEGGLHFFGGFAGAIAAVIFFVLRHPEIKLFKFSDAAAPSVALGLAIGKLGCFFAGCCYGKECSLPWAVTFTHYESLAVRGLPLHPSQLYEFFAYLAIFLILEYLYKLSAFDGQIFWLFVFLHSIARFHLEFFRWEKPVFYSLTLGSIFSVVFLVISVLMLLVLTVKWKKKNI